MTWLPVVGTDEQYEVSHDGRVRSMPRKGTNGGLVKAFPAGRGKDHLSLWICVGGKPKRRMVHQLVAEAFIGPRPSPEHQVCHWDGNGLNNHASNLRWGTASDQRYDDVRNGVHSSQVLRRRRAAD